MDSVVAEIEQRLEAYTEPIEVAVLGCAVNGIGEASHADFGITGAKDEGLIFAHGKPLRKVPQAELVDAPLRGDRPVPRPRPRSRSTTRRSAEGAAWLAKIEEENAGDLTPERIAQMEHEAAERASPTEVAARRGGLADRRPASSPGPRPPRALTRARPAAERLRLTQPMSPRYATIFWPTLKDRARPTPRPLSHQLMVRAGLIRQLGAGIWTYLPAGWRVHRKVEAIIREEMDAIGASGDADAGAAAGRAVAADRPLRDRRAVQARGPQGLAEMVLAMTHEEALTYHVARDVRSYRDLPLILYHLQIKERDEPRPRAGVLRTREFTMKDAYSFDRDEEGLERSYELHIGAYDRIFDRCGLRWYGVESDVGMMGGSGAHEYMAPCAGGRERGRAGARATPPTSRSPAPSRRRSSCRRRSTRPSRSPTPGLTTVEEVAAVARRRRRAPLIKALPVGRRRARLRPGAGPRRSPPQRDQARQPPRGGLPARHARRRSRPSSGRPGFIGPVGAEVPRAQGRRDRRRRATSPAPTGPTRT